MIKNELINHLSKVMILLIIFKISLLQFDTININNYDNIHILSGIYDMFSKDISFMSYYTIIILPLFILFYKKNIDYKYINMFILFCLITIYLINYITIYYLDRSIQIYDLYNISFNNISYLFDSINYLFLYLLIIPVIIYKINNFKILKLFLFSFISIVYMSFIIYNLIISNSNYFYKKNYITENIISNIIYSMFYKNKYLNNIDEYNISKIKVGSVDLPKLDLKNKNIFVFNLESLNYKYFTKENSPFLFSLMDNSINFKKMFTNYPSTKHSLVNFYYGDDLNLYTIKNSNKINNEYNNSDILNEFNKLGYNLNFTTSSISTLNGSFFDNDFFNNNFNFKKNIGIDLKQYNEDVYKENEYLNKYMEQTKDNEFNGYLTSMTHWPYYSFNNKETKEISVENYINSIKKQDEYFKELFLKYPILENSIIVFISDHGQGFGEHNFYSHGELYNEVLHIPAFIYFKDLKKIEIENYYSTSNVLPTLLSLLKKDIVKNSIFEETTNKYIISTNLNKISFINKETKEKYLFIDNDCIKFDLNKDFEEKEKLICDNKNIKEMFNHIKLKD